MSDSNSSLRPARSAAIACRYISRCRRAVLASPARVGFSAAGGALLAGVLATRAGCTVLDAVAVLRPPTAVRALLALLDAALVDEAGFAAVADLGLLAVVFELLFLALLVFAAGVALAAAEAFAVVCGFAGVTAFPVFAWVFFCSAFLGWAFFVLAAGWPLVTFLSFCTAMAG